MQAIDEHLARLHQRVVSAQAVQRHRLNDREQILDAMIKLADEQSLPFFDALALADVDDDDDDVVFSLGPDRLKPDLDRDFGAVPPPRPQVATRPHRAFARGACK
ncbi:MAG: hypothetical protein WAM17_15435 [Rhodoplanes sp.]